MKGIYGYYDKLNEEIVYIGKDSYIEKNERHKRHLQSSKYDEQTINRILQNNLDRYVYKPIYICPPYLNDDDLNGLEMQYIESLNPKFNFTKGGDGVCGYKHKPSTLEKLRNNPSCGMFGKKHSAETRKKMSESAKRRYKFHPISTETRKKMSDNHWDCSGENNPNYGKPLSAEHRKKISEAKKGRKNPNWKDYPRIIKYGHHNGQQQYGLIFRGKLIKCSIYKEKLEKMMNWYSELN